MDKSMSVFVAATCLAAVGLVGEGKMAWGREADRSLKQAPIGQPGRAARYGQERENNLPGSVVKTFTLSLGPVEVRAGAACQWLVLEATKTDGNHFCLWLLSKEYPPPIFEAAQGTIVRYILQEGDAEPTEFRNRSNGEAVLPSLGGWRYLLPRFPTKSESASESEP